MRKFEQEIEFLKRKLESRERLSEKINLENTQDALEISKFNMVKRCKK